MGGGGNDPYDDILAVCQKLNAIQPVTVAPVPLQAVQLGTFDASTGTFTWNSSLPLETKEDEIPGDPAGQKLPTEVTTMVYHFNAEAVAVRLSVDLVNNASGTIFTVGDQTAFGPPTSTVVSVEAPFSGTLLFTLTSGNHRAGGRVDATHIIYFGINVDRSHFSDFSGSLQQPGCVVVPALPIAIVYQPPTENGKGEFDSTQSTGVSINSVSGSSSTSGPGTLAGINVAIQALQTIAGIASLAGGYAAAVGGIASALAQFLSKFAGSNTVSMEVDNLHTLELTFTQENKFFSAPELGPGLGDQIVYLQDATFAVYGINGNFSYVPLGYRELTPAVVSAASLQPGATQPANLPDDIRAQLLALDPVASGNPDGVTDTSRYSFVKEFTLPPHTEQDWCWSYTKKTSTVQQMQFTETNESGQVVRVVIGGSGGMSQANTVSTCLNVKGPVDFEIWYDHLFDTFAYRDLSHMQSSTMSFEGTLPASGLPLLGQEVTVVQNGRAVTTLTDAQGHYLVSSSSLQPGPAQLLLPTSGGSPITQAINLSV